MDDGETKRGIPTTAELEKCRLLPEDYKPSEYDVVSGRGKGIYEKFGNKKFRSIVRTYVDNLQKHRTRKIKQEAIEEITDIVRSQNEGYVHFVRKSELHIGRWEELSAAEAKLKVCQAFRTATQPQAKTVAEDIGSQRSSSNSACSGELEDSTRSSLQGFLLHGQGIQNTEMPLQTQIAPFAASTSSATEKHSLDPAGWNGQTIRVNQLRNPFSPEYEPSIVHQWDMQPTRAHDVQTTRIPECPSRCQGVLPGSDQEALERRAYYHIEDDGCGQDYLQAQLSNSQPMSSGCRQYDILESSLQSQVTFDHSNVSGLIDAPQHMFAYQGKIQDLEANERIEAMEDRHFLADEQISKVQDSILNASAFASIPVGQSETNANTLADSRWSMRNSEQDTQTSSLFTCAELDEVLGSLDWSDPSHIDTYRPE